MKEFEKGLMLAGYILPSSIDELNEKIELEKFELQLREYNKHTYFKRIVLGAKIAEELHDHPTFGRVKFQKLMYICEYVAQLHLQDRYAKQAAGPFDNKFMHSIDEEFKVRRWFDVVKLNDGKMTRTKYLPLENISQYRSYYSAYFNEYRSNITRIIDLFKTLKTDTTEIAATLLACKLEIEITNSNISEDKLFALFYSWSKEKNRFDIETVKRVWIWMHEKQLIDL
jgi:hypothetical protein